MTSLIRFLYFTLVEQFDFAEATETPFIITQCKQNGIFTCLGLKCAENIDLSTLNHCIKVTRDCHSGPYIVIQKI